MPLGKFAEESQQYFAPLPAPTRRKLFPGEYTIVLKDETELTTVRSFRERLRGLLENKVGTAGISSHT